MNITVKNIPDSIYRVMKREAKRERRSLNAQIIQVLETEGAEAARRRQLSNLRKELERFAASLPPLDDSVPLIRGDRGRCVGRSSADSSRYSPGGIRQSGSEA